MKNAISKKYPRLNKISDTERVRMVKEIFSTVTREYDFLNHFLSLRRDVSWRRFAVKKMRFPRTHRLLDVATGTSDLAIEAALFYPDIQILGLDFVKEMIELGRKKIEKKDLSKKIKLVQGDALHIPAASDSFDAAAIAFGIRNMPRKIQVLQEMTRVVVPGGQILVLEMTLPRTPFLRGIYNTYLNMILPRIAHAFSPNHRAYYYLGDSIMDFSTAYDFALLMRSAGLSDIETHSLSLGITRLYIGYKPGSAHP